MSPEKEPKPNLDTVQPGVEQMHEVNPAVAQDIGELVLAEQMQTPGATAENLPGNYDKLTTPLSSDVDILKRDLGLDAGVTGDSQLESIAWQAEQIRPDARIAINMPVNSLSRFLTEGRYVSAVESGIGTSSNRADQELARGFRTADEPPLVYGYLTSTQDSQFERANVDGYGGAQINLRSVKTRDATFTSGDSMNMGITKESLRNFDDALVLEQARQLALQGNDTGLKDPYIEAQIHGNVETSEIESITVPLDTSEKTTGQALPEMVSLLENNLPDAEKVIKIDVTEIMHEASTVLTIAQEHPGVTIELVVRQTATEGELIQRQPRFIASKLKTEPGGTSEAYGRMNSRIAKLQEGVSELASRYGLAEVPANLRIVSGVGDTSHAARKNSHNPNNLTATRAA